MSQDSSNAPPSLAEASRVWWKIGVVSFGGPAAQIALMHKEIVEARGWLGEQQYLNALSFCMLLPGPEAMQLATYAGWRLHGVLGGLIAGLLFVLPGAAVIMALATIYSLFGAVPIVEALFYGIKAAVLVIVIEALLRVSQRALKHRSHKAIALIAFTGIFFFALPYPLIVFCAAIYGWATASGALDPQAEPISAPVSAWRTLRTVAIWLGIWALPFGLLITVNAPPLLLEIASFFSRLAVVTFGGAYAVLAYMAQDIVGNFGWVTPDQMVDALGLAETTPGPLILVTQFVGFLAGFKAGGLPLALAAGIVALWVTFAPCFLWVFTGAPFIEWISAQPRLRGALQAITAAVVGVILNLSIWFGLHVLFSEVSQVHWNGITLWRPTLSSIEWLTTALLGLNSILVFGYHWNILKILSVSSLLGAILHLSS